MPVKHVLKNGILKVIIEQFNLVKKIRISLAAVISTKSVLYNLKSNYYVDNWIIIKI